MSESKRKFSPFLLILLLLSIGLNAYLFYSLNQKNNTIEKLNQDVDDLIQRVKTLEAVEESLNTQMDQTMADLDEFKGLSADLDSLLADAKKDISAKQSRIRQLQKDVKTQKNLTSELQKEIAELSKLKESYMDQIDSLIQTNNLLQAQVTEFTGKVKSLEKTVESGSIINSDDIKATTYKQRIGGKYVTTALAKKTEKLEVCFDLVANKIAEPGEKNIYVRVISPEGVTLGSDTGGGGTFEAKSDSTEYRYTLMGTVDYENTGKNYCVDWVQENAFQSGNYQVEIYTDGYFSGVGAFILK